MQARHDSRRWGVLLAICTALPLLAPAAGANDSEISFGGAPRMLDGRGTVSMAGEVVRLAVNSTGVTVDARFVFVNHGPNCTVRMGFPDESNIGAELGNAFKGTFLSFHSYVDGKEVPTAVVQSDRPGRVWHAKTVGFATNGRREVRDVYTVPTSGGISAIEGSYSAAGYVLSTGASWRGNIGSSEVSITFAASELPGSLRAISLASVLPRTLGIRRDGSAVDWRRYPAGTVAYRGPAKPTVKGRTLTFKRTNWRPRAADDIELYWRPARRTVGG